MITFKRLAGIIYILYEQRSEIPKFRIIFKWSDRIQYAIRDFFFLFFVEEICSLEDLISDSENFDSIRWNLLFWSLGITNDYCYKDIKKIRIEHVVIVSSLMFEKMVNGNY